MNHDLNEYLEFAKRIAHHAGDVMMKYFNQKDITTVKDDNTLVTLADTEINSYLIEQVKAHYPTHAVLGEEESYSPESSSSNQENTGCRPQACWVCDPVDGTANFARGIPLFAFSLALVIDNVTVLGVAYDPVLKNLYSAIKGQGAFKNGKKFTTKQRALDDPRAFGSHSARVTIGPFIAELSKHLPTKWYTAYCAIVPELVKVAEGEITFAASIYARKADYFIDIAAVQLIVTEAGGRITDFAGKEIPPFSKISGLVASNGLVHDEVLRACNIAQEKLEGGK